MQLIERRKLPRVNIGLPAIMENGNSTVIARTIDVSRGGTLIDSPMPLQTGDVVTLKLELDVSSLEPIKAKVLRSTPAFWGRRHTLAVQFDEGNAALMDIVNLVSQMRDGRNRGRWLSHDDAAI